MNVNRYMTEIVEPTIGDFEQNPISVRHAFLACVVTFHCIDYMTEGSRQQYREECPEFAIVDRVAHAFKHVRTGNPNSKQIPPLQAADVITRPPGVWGQAVWDLSRWDDPVGGVRIRDEVERDLLEIVRAAAAFLRHKIKQCP